MQEGMENVVGEKEEGKERERDIEINVRGEYSYTNDLDILLGVRNKGRGKEGKMLRHGKRVRNEGMGRRKVGI